MTEGGVKTQPSHGPKIGLIWAQAHKGVIGLDGVMPWHLPEDLAHFKAVTLGAPVVMGRRTWQSLPERFRPLPGRRNLVVTRDISFSEDGAEICYSVEDALARASEALDSEDWIWVIGGAKIFEETLPLANRIELTEIDADVSGDTFAPRLGDEWMRDPSADETWLNSAANLSYRFVTLTKR